MLEVKLDALEAGIQATRIALRDGVLSINIWDKQTGLTLIDWQGNPTAVALFNQITQELEETLQDSGFSQLKDYYFLDLQDKKSLVVMDHGDQLMEAWLLDSTKTNPGILYGMAIPRALANADQAKIDKADDEDESIEALNLLLSSAKMGLWDMKVDAGNPVSPDNEFTWSNEFRYMLGFESEEDFPNILSSWSNRLHPDHKEKAMQALADHLNDHSGNTPYDIEYKLQRKTGEYRWYRATGETSRDANGVPLRIVGALKDIQEEREKSGNNQWLNHAD